ncbi:hypothetical protein CYLTODRAFT_457458 [Cylindrobasidium torrendii FP15055 ss-10]|uniref:Uncharacterized protein n=1 Tax=Cylindrobasidium torrendii FP15055 ss-10 TaxID=1314674 RepID=A0A0D7B0N2_9AGAR|nr:hypothetical protein CYLTODRAFT_457458 [Cylindrobasidium torrendii FP15055 ss-10]
MERNEVYAALTEAELAGKFHWIIYVAKGKRTGHKIHATTNGNTTPWQFEAKSWDGPSSVAAVAFLKIGHIADDADYSHLVRCVEDIPMSIPENQRARESKFTCRVWFKEAIRTLNEIGLFVKCDDVDALEAELIQKTSAAQYLRGGGEGSRKVLTAVAKKAEAWS